MAVLSPGDVLGAYAIQSLIGTGGMGEVYRAHDERLDRLVAVKVLRHGATDERARARFVREARTVAKLRHPGVVAIFDVGEHDGLPFLVMELVEGPSLATVIDERRAVPLETKCRYVVDVCDALSHAHERGIIHRDVKPGNVLIDDGRARLADFGIALDTQSTGTSVGGSPNYFAPEQLAGNSDHRSDLFSLGAVFYELLTGTKAFPGSISDGVLYRIVHEPAQVLPPSVGGAEIAEVVLRALAKNPQERFQSAAEFKSAVASVSGVAVVAGGSTIGTPHSPNESDVTMFRRRLLESAVPAEIRRLKYEVDQYLALQPHDVDGRMLSDQIERALVVSVAGSDVPRASSWRRPAAYASAVGVAIIAVSTFVLLRSVPQPTPSGVATTPARPMPTTPPATPENESPPTGVQPPVTSNPFADTRPAPVTVPPTTGGPEPPPSVRQQGRANTARAGVTPTPVGPSVPPTPALAPALVEREPVLTPAPVTRAPEPPAARPGAPPSPGPAQDEAAIREVLAQYTAGYNGRNAETIRRVWPRGPDLRESLAGVKSYQLALENLEITISGDTATATAVRRIRIQPEAGGGPLLQSSRITFSLGRTGGVWVIDGIR